MSSSSAADRSSFAARRRRVEQRRRALRLWRGRAAVALLFGLIAGLMTVAPWAGPLERAGLDALFVARHWLFGPLFPAERSDVAVVVIDEETYHTHPFAARPRVAWSPYLAAVIEAIDAAGPRVIGYDLVDPTTLDQPDLLPRFDRPLLRALAGPGREGRLVLGEIRLSGEMIGPTRGQRIAVGGDDNVRLLNLIVDPDEVVRRQAISFTTEGGGAMPSFAVELARRAGAAIPAAEFLVNFNTGPGDLPTYSLGDLLACAEGGRREFFERAFKGKVVLIGLALDVEDRRYGAKWLLPERADSSRQARCLLPANAERFDARIERRTMPGVFIHAAAVNTLTKGLALEPLGPAARFLAVTLAGIAMALIFFALSPPAGLLAGAAAFAAQALGAVAAFRAGLVAPVGLLAATAALAFALVYAYRFVIEDRDRRRISAAFRHYLAPELVDRLAADPDALRLGGERRRITVMFTDLVGYTALTERLGEQPERLVEILNRYLAAASAIVGRQGGYVDKFIGDAVMAIWGAPLDHAQAERHAVEAALDLVAAVAELAATMPAGDAGLSVRVGINSGVAIVGNMGSESRKNYTATGDVVNLAARLEGANKAYGTTIMIGAGVAARLGDAFVLRELDRLIVKGRTEAERVFEVVGRREAVDARIIARLEAFAAALARYRARDFAAAADAFGALAPVDPVARLYAGRASDYARHPPPADWTGSFALDTK
ncbi:MAG: adenylate/guanylate cyclase domain-containing protein [Phreatobacter sp.]|uniref:adenylate/guanylate cyclase domain-containing protein n=1 Tax=Phreatobacter sp. TaxID=1966341 RepID=UPI001A3DFEC0|nr:adenylate/guanylate cyclase domain-containing protein [Phreatobacter sp.]MBL8571868.1 adenylate/guanylate cyclase domain-containing protein [Phreatobacter sp.]